MCFIFFFCCQMKHRRSNFYANLYVFGTDFELVSGWIALKLCGHLASNSVWAIVKATGQLLWVEQKFTCTVCIEYSSHLSSRQHNASWMIHRITRLNTRYMRMCSTTTQKHFRMRDSSSSPPSSASCTWPVRCVQKAIFSATGAVIRQTYDRFN